MPPKRPGIQPIHIAVRPPTNLSEHGVHLPNGNFIPKASEFVMNGATYALNISELTLIDELGHGQYGSVTRVIHNPTKTTMAMKEIPFANDNTTANSIIIELNVLVQSQSDYIVRFYGAFFHDTKVCYCMEYMDYGSLDRLYRCPVSEVVLARIAYSMVEGLLYLKEKLNIMHRDVKPTNVLVNAQGDVKLCDFGVSGRLLAGSIAYSHVGCRPYMAPERIETMSPDAAYSVNSDVWSLGLSILEVGNAAFPYGQFESIFAQLTAIVKTEPQELPERFSDNARDFVKKCIAKVANDRPRYSVLLKHPFLAGADNIQLRQEVAAWARAGHELYMSRPKAAQV